MKISIRSLASFTISLDSRQPGRGSALPPQLMVQSSRGVCMLSGSEVCAALGKISRHLKPGSFWIISEVPLIFYCGLGALQRENNYLTGKENHTVFGTELRDSGEQNLQRELAARREPRSQSRRKHRAPGGSTELLEAAETPKETTGLENVQSGISLQGKAIIAEKKMGQGADNKEGNVKKSSSECNRAIRTEQAPPRGATQTPRNTAFQETTPVEIQAKLTCTN